MNEYKKLARMLYEIIDNDLLPCMTLLYHGGCKKHSFEDTKEWLKPYKEDIMPKVKKLLEMKKEIDYR